MKADHSVCLYLLGLTFAGILQMRGKLDKPIT